jgi:hypothetical protein
MGRSCADKFRCFLLVSWHDSQFESGIPDLILNEDCVKNNEQQRKIGQFEIRGSASGRRSGTEQCCSSMERSKGH